MLCKSMNPSLNFICKDHFMIYSNKMGTLEAFINLKKLKVITM